MAQDFDIRMFFKRAPHPQLRRYFTEKGQFSNFDWGSISTKNVDPLVSAWNAIDTAAAANMLGDFVSIKRLASPAGKAQIIDEAGFHGLATEVAAKFLELPDPFNCAFWTFFERRQLWEGAVAFANADSKPERSWRKRMNMPRLGREPTPADGEALAAAVSEVFMRTEARGQHCLVHQFRRGATSEREYYFAHPEDHRQTALEYQNGEMTKRPHAPAFEVIFLHEDDRQTLSIWHRGSKERIWDLQEAFSVAVLGTNLPAESLPDELVYDLDVFRDPDFDFKPASELGIAKAEVREITVRLLGSEPHSITVKLEKGAPKHLLHAKINAATAGMRTSMVKVARVGITATFERGPDDKKQKSRSFMIGWPNSCSLAGDIYGLRLQRMLVDRGIEPSTAKPDAEE